MLKVRQAQWPQDISLLTALDTSFTTDRVYQPIRDGLSFRLEEESVAPSTAKSYDFDFSDEAERASWSFAAIAEEDGNLTGFAAVEREVWNNRVNIRHIYVMPAFRRRGVGRLLLDQLENYARSINSRSLWLETQNTNYPAIQFYLRSGFRFCGFDSGLYDPSTTPPDEIALFFERSVPHVGQAGSL